VGLYTITELIGRLETILPLFENTITVRYRANIILLNGAITGSVIFNSKCIIRNRFLAEFRPPAGHSRELMALP